MSDIEQKILEIVHRPQLAALATITEQGNPWVRYVVTVGGGDLSLRCATFTESRKVKQIESDPNVHVTCGVTSLEEMKPYLQVQGRARITSDKEERHAFWNDMLEPIFEGPDDPRYCLIVIDPYRIEYCTPESFEPEVWTR